MAEFKIAKIFKNGGSQAVRLPAEFRFEGDEVRLSRHGNGILIEPARLNTQALFEKFDRFTTVDFMDDREQPPMPQNDVSL